MLPATIIVLAGVVLTWLSWRRWTDILMDYGKELYVAWQLAEGKALYSDLAWVYGPVSPYLNALLFKIFGTSFTVLFISNLLMTALLVFLIYRLFILWTNPLPATVCCLVFLALFGFGHLHHLGSFNFICPYSHGLTHSILLAMIGIAALCKFFKSPKPVFLACAHLSLGLVLLNKPEVFIAFAGTTLAAWIFILKTLRPAAKKLFQLLAIGGLGLILPSVLFVLAHSSSLSFAQALHNAFFCWEVIEKSSITESPFFQEITGLDKLLRSIVEIILISLFYVLGLGILYLVNQISARRKGTYRLVTVALTVAILAVGIALMGKPYWLHLIRPLPVLMIAILVGIAVKLKRHRGEQELLHRLGPLTLFTIFATLMLAKIGLRTYLDGFGFALAMPATLLAVAAVLDWLPRWLGQRSAHTSMIKMALWSSLVITLTWFVKTSMTNTLYKTLAFGTGQNRMMAYPEKVSTRDACLLQTLDFIEKNFNPGERFTVLPEGAMLNYMTGHESSMFYNFIPHLLDIYGEQKMLTELSKDPPDYVILCSRNTSIRGTSFFGFDYGHQLYGWISNNYSTLKQIGTWPPQTDQFGLVIMHRSSPTSPEIP